MRCILAATPLDLVDLFFDLEGLQVVELRLVRLELGVELVFASLLLERGLDLNSNRTLNWKTYSLVPLEQNHTTTLVTSRQVITCLVELDSGDDVRYFATLAITDWSCAAANVAVSGGVPVTYLLLCLQHRPCHQSTCEGQYRP